MAENAGNLEVRLGANIRDFQRKMDAAQARMKRTADASKRLAGAVAGVGAAAGVAAGAAVRLAGKFEQAEIAFATMLGSAKEAKRFLSDLADFAARTPFNFTGLQQSSRLLLAFGFEAERVVPIMRTLGDATSALGGSTAELNGVVRAIGQMQTKGKVAAQELLQLAERGIPAFEILQEKLGLTGEQVSEIGTLGIDSATAINALLEGLSERFAGSMQQQSRTLLGLFSTVQDEVELTMIELGQDIIDALNLKEVTANAIEALGRFRDRVEEIRLAGILEEWKNGLIVVASTIGAALLPALASLTIAAASAALALAPFLIGGAIAGGLFLLARRFHDVAQNGQDFREEVDEGKDALDRFEESAKTAKTAIEKLTEATDEDGFLGAVTSLADTLNTDAGAALESFARAHGLPLIAQGELQDAIDVTLGKFAELRRGSLEAELASAEALQATILNRLQLLRNDLTFFIDELERAKAAGDQAGVIIATEEFEKTQAQVESMTGQYLEQSRTISDLRAEIHELGEAQAVLNDETLTAEERLDKFLELLGFVPTATREAAGAAEELGKKTETAGEKAKKAAEEFAKLVEQAEALRAVRLVDQQSPVGMAGRGANVDVLREMGQEAIGERRAAEERARRARVGGTQAFDMQVRPGMGLRAAEEALAQVHEATRRLNAAYQVQTQTLNGQGLIAAERDLLTRRRDLNAAYQTATQVLGGKGLIAAERELTDKRKAHNALVQTISQSFERMGLVALQRKIDDETRARKAQVQAFDQQVVAGKGLIAAERELTSKRREAAIALHTYTQTIDGRRGLIAAERELNKERQRAVVLSHMIAGRQGLRAAEGRGFGGYTGVTFNRPSLGSIFGNPETFVASFDNAARSIEETIGALTAAFGNLASAAGSSFNAAFSAFSSMVQGMLMLTQGPLGIVTGVLNILAGLVSFFMFGKSQKEKSEQELATTEPKGGAFGVERGDRSYKPQVALSVGRSNASPATGTPIINAGAMILEGATIFDSAVTRFDEIVSRNRFARTNGGL